MNQAAHVAAVKQRWQQAARSLVVVVVAAKKRRGEEERSSAGEQIVRVLLGSARHLLAVDARLAEHTRQHVHQVDIDDTRLAGRQLIVQLAPHVQRGAHVHVVVAQARCITFLSKQ